MEQPLNVKQMLGASVVRSPSGLITELKFNNPFAAQLVRNGKVIKTVSGTNGVTDVGINHLFDVTFGNTSPVAQVDPWYELLINNSPTPTLAPGDTLALHTGWVEFTGYTGNRQAWVDSNSVARVKGTTTVSTFPITATGVIYGIGVCSVATGTSGVLWATGAFDSPLSVVNTDEIRVTYGVRA